MMQKRVALIGCGRWGKNILRDLLALQCEVYVVDPAPKVLDELQAKGIQAYSTIEGLPEVEGYIVACPTALHAQVLLQLSPLRRPIFCEKPLTCNYAEAVAVQSQLKAPVFVMDKWRYHAGVEALANIAKSQALGKVLGLRTVRVQWNQPHRDVNAIWILAPHDLSIAEKILGAVPALKSAVFEAFRGETEGVIATFGEAPWFVMEISSMQPQTRREIRLICEHGLAILDDPLATHIKIQKTVGLDAKFEPEQHPIPAVMPLYKELETFVHYLGGGPEPQASIAEAVKMVKIIEDLQARYIA